MCFLLTFGRNNRIVFQSPKNPQITLNRSRSYTQPLPTTPSRAVQRTTTSLCCSTLTSRPKGAGSVVTVVSRPSRPTQAQLMVGQRTQWVKIDVMPMPHPTYLHFRELPPRTTSKVTFTLQDFKVKVKVLLGYIPN